MAKKKPKVLEFRSIEEMHMIPADKIDHFCRDLAIWLLLHKIADAEGGLRIRDGEQEYATKRTSPRDVFGWLDDDSHLATITLTHVRRD
jgi:hypothetical protein